MSKGLLIEDDPAGLERAKRCAPDPRTKQAYGRTDIEWHWVKNIDEFKTWISKNGMPTLFAFDHDLGDDAYALWHKHRGYVDSEINYDEYVTPTGYHCAKWLTDYCIDNKIEFTAEVFSHSMNDKGRQNIISILENFKKHQYRYGI